MGRSILALLLAMILTISHVSNNPTRSVCESLFIIFAPHRHCYLATTLSKGKGLEGHWVYKGHANPLKLQLDCH